MSKAGRSTHSRWSPPTVRWCSSSPSVEGLRRRLVRPRELSRRTRAYKLIAVITELATAVATKAGELAKAADRTTLLDDDIQAAFDHKFGQIAQPDPTVLHRLINELDTPNLKQLIRGLIVDLEDDDRDDIDDILHDDEGDGVG